MTMSVRSDLRRDHARVVRARCRKCSRVLAELYGDDMALAAWASPDGSQSGMVVQGARAVVWRCRCGGNYPVRGEKLAAAFEVAAAQVSKGDRVIWLPDQV